MAPLPWGIVCHPTDFPALPARTPHTDPQRDSIFIPRSRDPADVLDHATSGMASPREINHWQRPGAIHGRIISPGQGSKLGFDATKKLPGEGHTSVSKGTH